MIFDVPGPQKPERGCIRQTRPFAKPPFCFLLKRNMEENKRKRKQRERKQAKKEENGKKHKNRSNPEGSGDPFCENPNFWALSARMWAKPVGGSKTKAAKSRSAKQEMQNLVIWTSAGGSEPFLPSFLCISFEGKKVHKSRIRD